MNSNVQAGRAVKEKNKDNVIECQGLEFSYNGLAVLRGMDFNVRRGEVFALLGPNGAGKTTTIRVQVACAC